MDTKLLTMEWVIILPVLLLLLIAFEQLDRRRRFRENKLPPGPRGVPYVGNLFQFWKARGNGSLNFYVSVKTSRQRLSEILAQ
jgi:hypothetical protein